jgi:mannose-6-phosphate isomerase-like protein (cupin superfamily)
MIGSLKSGVHPLTIPLPPDHHLGWKPTPLFKGSTEIMLQLSCHASVLQPGCCPHPPHTHGDEEILILLKGEADLIFPDPSSPDGTSRHNIQAGEFVYYPSGFYHTLEAGGVEPANYLMFRWTGTTGDYVKPLTFQKYSTTGPAPARKKNHNHQLHRFLKGPTRGLRILEGHLSILPTGCGYEPHRDQHDVVIVVLEGEVETLGKKIKPNDVILYRAGDPHGMLNPGGKVARYLVFEFHGSSIPVKEFWPVRLLVKIARKILPVPIKERLSHLMRRVLR